VWTSDEAEAASWPCVSMMGILPGPTPPISDVRHSGSAPAVLFRPGPEAVPARMERWHPARARHLLALGVWRPDPGRPAADPGAGRYLVADPISGRASGEPAWTPGDVDLRPEPDHVPRMSLCVVVEVRQRLIHVGSTSCCRDRPTPDRLAFSVPLRRVGVDRGVIDGPPERGVGEARELLDQSPRQGCPMARWAVECAHVAQLGR
jgi:hypothetical protein